MASATRQMIGGSETGLIAQLERELQQARDRAKDARQQESLAQRLERALAELKRPAPVRATLPQAPKAPKRSRETVSAMVRRVMQQLGGAVTASQIRQALKAEGVRVKYQPIYNVLAKGKGTRFEHTPEGWRMLAH